MKTMLPEPSSRSACRICHLMIPQTWSANPVTDNSRTLVDRLRHPTMSSYMDAPAGPMGLAVMDERAARAAMNEAADEIERLCTLVGKADVGPSFAEITANAPRKPAHDDTIRALDDDSRDARK